MGGRRSTTLGVVGGITAAALIVVTPLANVDARSSDGYAASVGSLTTLVAIVPTPNSVTVIGGTEGESLLVRDIADRYGEAGLDLPPMTITFADGTDDCDGNQGIYQGNGEITVCITTPKTIAHEMAHAWVEDALTDADREAYRRLWGAPTWGSAEFPWELRATEKAADTIAWALLVDDGPRRETFRSHLCTYESLTGLPLPNPPDPPCESTLPYRP